MLRFSADATSNGTCVPADTGHCASDGEHRSVVPASSSACSSLRTALREGWKLSPGGGGGGCLRLNKKGQQSSDVITALWGQGEIRVSWLVNNWAETGLCCCQQVAFTAARILHAMRVAAIVRLSTRAPPKVFLTVSFLQRGNVWPAARLDGVPWGFCKPQELPLFALCKVLGHVQDQSQGFSQ